MTSSHRQVGLGAALGLRLPPPEPLTAAHDGRCRRRIAGSPIGRVGERAVLFAGIGRVGAAAALPRLAWREGRAVRAAPASTRWAQ